jgi:predicted nucleic acid-binding protein
VEVHSTFVGESAATDRLELSLDSIFDERAATRVALTCGLKTTGTIALLDPAADRNLLVFAEAITRLESTNFWRPRKVLELFLKKHLNR